MLKEWCQKPIWSPVEEQPQIGRWVRWSTRTKVPCTRWRTRTKVHGNKCAARQVQRQYQWHQWTPVGEVSAYIGETRGVYRTGDPQVSHPHCTREWAQPVVRRASSGAAGGSWKFPSRKDGKIRIRELTPHQRQRRAKGVSWWWCACGRWARSWSLLSCAHKAFLYPRRFGRKQAPLFYIVLNIIAHCHIISYHYFLTRTWIGIHCNVPITMLQLFPCSPKYYPNYHSLS